MTTKDLAKIERVDLREAWPNEAQNFTPWLAENIAELAEALGMDLELQQTEAPVGGYSLDILATDLNSNRPVIIENQLEATDHTHLGQLLTYAAGFDAGALIWVTREFRDEHRQALDWLNQRTGEDTEFFGVVVELWSIAGSPPAPHFRLAATPNGWRKQSLAARSRETSVLSERDAKYQVFFQPLIDELRDEYQFTRAKVAPAKSWCRLPSGVGSKFHYCAAFIARNSAKVELNVDSDDTDWNARQFESLRNRGDDIQAQFAETFTWDRVDGRRACRIYIQRPGTIEDDPQTLEDIQSWMLANLLRFREVFDPMLREMVDR